MLNKSLTTSLLASCLVLASFQLAAQPESNDAMPDNVPELLVKANDAYNAKDYIAFRDTLMVLTKMRPHNSEYMYQLVLAHALLGEKSPAYDLMLRMQRQGLSYDFTTSDSTLKIRGTEVFDFINDMMMMAGEPVGESEVVFTLPDDVAMPETISWDESRQKFLVGTVSEGSILAVGEDGQVDELLRANEENGLWSVFDVLVDQPRKRLWVSSAANQKFSRFDPIDTGRSALFEFDLETLELIRRYPVPVDGSPHALGNMVLGPTGDIYVIDRALPIIYRKSAGEQKLRAIIASSDMVSMRGAAMRSDGKIMYVADREMGILVIDFVGQRAVKLSGPVTLNLGGIDGLFLWENNLVIIQNGIKPQRVMRLQLDESGTTVENIRPLAVAQPVFDYPSFGTVKGQDLYYFANSQWTAGDDQLKRVTVLRTALNSSEDLAQPDMEKFMEKYLEQKGKAEGVQGEHTSPIKDH